MRRMRWTRRTVNRMGLTEWMTNKLSLQRSSAKTDENVTTSVFECLTDASSVAVSNYSIASPTEKCQVYGGSCVPAGDCPTVRLYGQYHHTILACNSDTVCCLPQRNFYSVFGERDDLARRALRRRRYRPRRRRHIRGRPWRRLPWWYRWFRPRYRSTRYRYRW